MPVHSTLSPIGGTVKALDALLSALDGNPFAAVLEQIRADAADKAQGEERERIVLTAWEGITGSQEAAA